MLTSNQNPSNLRYNIYRHEPWYHITDQSAYSDLYGCLYIVLTPGVNSKKMIQAELGSHSYCNATLTLLTFSDVTHFGCQSGFCLAKIHSLATRRNCSGIVAVSTYTMEVMFFVWFYLSGRRITENKKKLQVQISLDSSIGQGRPQYIFRVDLIHRADPQFFFYQHCEIQHSNQHQAEIWVSLSFPVWSPPNRSGWSSSLAPSCPTWH